MGTIPEDAGDSGSDLIDQWLAKREPPAVTPKQALSEEPPATTDTSVPPSDSSTGSQDDSVGDDPASRDDSGDVDALDPLTAPLPQLLQHEERRRGVLVTDVPDQLDTPPSEALTTEDESVEPAPEPIDESVPGEPASTEEPDRAAQPSGQLSDEERRDRLSQMLKSRLVPKEDPADEGSTTLPPPPQPKKSRRAATTAAAPPACLAGTDWQRALFDPADLAEPAPTDVPAPTEPERVDPAPEPVEAKAGDEPTPYAEPLSPEPASPVSELPETAETTAPEPVESSAPQANPTDWQRALFANVDEEPAVADEPAVIEADEKADVPVAAETVTQEPAARTGADEPSEEIPDQPAEDTPFRPSAPLDVFAALRDTESPATELDTRESFEGLAKSRRDEETKQAQESRHVPTHSGEPDTPRLSDAAVMEPALAAVLRSIDREDAPKKRRLFGRRNKRHDDAEAIRRSATPAGQRRKSEMSAEEPEDDLPGWLDELATEQPGDAFAPSTEAEEQEPESEEPAALTPEPEPLSPEPEPEPAEDTPADPEPAVAFAPPPEEEAPESTFFAFAPEPEPAEDAAPAPEPEPESIPEPEPTTDPEPVAAFMPPEPEPAVPPVPEPVVAFAPDPEPIPEPTIAFAPQPDPEPEPTEATAAEPDTEPEDEPKFETLEELLAAATARTGNTTITKPVIEEQPEPEHDEVASDPEPETDAESEEEPAAPSTAPVSVETQPAAPAEAAPAEEPQPEPTNEVDEDYDSDPDYEDEDYTSDPAYDERPAADSRKAAAVLAASTEAQPDTTTEPTARKPQPSRKKSPRNIPAQPAAEKPGRSKKSKRASAGSPLPDRIELTPQRGTQRLLGTLLLFGFMSTLLLGWIAWDTRTTQHIAYAATAAVLTLILWGAHSTAEPAKIVCERGLLDIRSNDSHHRFDLASPYTRLEVIGTPGRRGWKVHILRKSMKPYVIDDSMVDAKEFTRILDHYEAARNRPTH